MASNLFSSAPCLPILPSHSPSCLPPDFRQTVELLKRGQPAYRLQAHRRSSEGEIKSDGFCSNTTVAEAGIAANKPAMAMLRGSELASSRAGPLTMGRGVAVGDASDCGNQRRERHQGTFSLPPRAWLSPGTKKRKFSSVSSNDYLRYWELIRWMVEGIYGERQY